LKKQNKCPVFLKRAYKLGIFWFKQTSLTLLKENYFSVINYLIHLIFFSSCKMPALKLYSTTYQIKAEKRKKNDLILNFNFYQTILSS